MKSKKIVILSLIVILSVGMLFGCNSEEVTQPPEDNETDTQTPDNTTENPEETGKYKDGIYFAQEKGFSEKSGWKYVVTIEVKNGNIVSADWNGANKKGGADKDTLSKAGKYGMFENGGAQAPWYKQAEAAEAYLIETQDPTAIEYIDDEGHTDAISGASIHVIEFFNLAEEALAKGPVGRGPYEDGAYRAREPVFGKTGWRYFVDLTVINGNIVAADWNGLHKDGGDDKDTLSAAGEYGMFEKGGAQAPWYQQAQAAEKYLLEVQDPTAIEYTDDEGHTDAISGASIHVIEFFNLAEEALAKGPIDPFKYEDGIYFAQEKGFSEKTGWKYVVTIEVKDGKIVAADWNGANKKGGVDKDTLSLSGKYGMVENGGAQAPWYKQAEAAEAYLLETQDPTAIEYTDDEGHTDAISGASIHVIEFFNLAEEALANGPVGKGPYKDGAYHAEEPEFSEKSGWKYFVDITVINGNIVAADWNGLHKDGGDDKDTLSANGEYGMFENGGAQAPWYQQAQAAEAYLLKVQDPTKIEYTDDAGHTDAISGASIHVIEFFNLAEEALKDAK